MSKTIFEFELQTDGSQWQIAPKLVQPTGQNAGYSLGVESFYPKHSMQSVDLENFAPYLVSQQKWGEPILAAMTAYKDHAYKAEKVLGATLASLKLRAEGLSTATKGASRSESGQDSKELETKRRNQARYLYDLGEACDVADNALCTTILSQVEKGKSSSRGNRYEKDLTNIYMQASNKCAVGEVELDAIAAMGYAVEKDVPEGAVVEISRPETRKKPEEMRTREDWMHHYEEMAAVAPHVVNNEGRFEWLIQENPLPNRTFSTYGTEARRLSDSEKTIKKLEIAVQNDRSRQDLLANVRSKKQTLVKQIKGFADFLENEMDTISEDYNATKETFQRYWTRRSVETNNSFEEEDNWVKGLEILATRNIGKCNEVGATALSSLVADEDRGPWLEKASVARKQKKTSQTRFKICKEQDGWKPRGSLKTWLEEGEERRMSNKQSGSGTVSKTRPISSEASDDQDATLRGKSTATHGTPFTAGGGSSNHPSPEPSITPISSGGPSKGILDTPTAEPYDQYDEYGETSEEEDSWRNRRDGRRTASAMGRRERPRLGGRRPSLGSHTRF